METYVECDFVDVEPGFKSYYVVWKHIILPITRPD